MHRPPRNMTPRVRRALRATRRALARQHEREARRLIGRWALPSGLSFKVVRIEGDRSLCGNGRERWWIETATLTALVNARALTYLGR